MEWDTLRTGRLVLSARECDVTDALISLRDLESSWYDGFWLKVLELISLCSFDALLSLMDCLLIVESEGFVLRTGVEGFLLRVGIEVCLFNVGIDGFLFNVGIDGFLFNVGIDGFLFSIGIDGFLVNDGNEGFLFNVGIEGFLFNVGIEGFLLREDADDFLCRHGVVDKDKPFTPAISSELCLILLGNAGLRNSPCVGEAYSFVG